MRSAMAVQSVLMLLAMGCADQATSDGATGTAPRADSGSESAADVPLVDGSAARAVDVAGDDAGDLADDDGGTAALDTARSPVDSGLAKADSELAKADSGPIHTDSGPAQADSGPAHVDSGPAHVDSGPAHVDTGPTCVPTKPPADVCDGIDNDCDGKTDTVPCPPKSCHTVACKAGKCAYTPTTTACSDGNACTIGDTCSGGVCKPGKAKNCSDGDPCDGIETCNPKTGKCAAAAKPTCPKGPEWCKSGGSGSPVKSKLVAADPAGFRLADKNLWSASEKLIAAIGAHKSAKVVSLATVLGNLNRTGKNVSSVPSVKCMQRGFRWDSGDEAVGYWYPQGLTGSWDGNASGTYAGKKLLIATWYHKPDKDKSTSKNKGGRISIVDVTTKSAPKYRHVLLVEAIKSGSTVTYKPIVFHAGGIAWYGNYLYVVHTTVGLRVFDIRRFVEVQTGDKGVVGWSSKHKAYKGFGYRYVLPQVNHYSMCKICCTRFSFVGVDRTANPPSLLTGEYAVSSYHGRLHRWLLEPKTGRLQTNGNLAQAKAAFFPGVRRMQGALSIGPEIWISSSDKYPGTSSIASLYRYTGLGSSVLIRKLPRVPEDVTYHKGGGSLWILTEFPNKRYTWAMPEAKLPTSACK